jgi:hypothetical protein
VFNGSNTTLDMGDHSDYDVRAFTLEGWFNFAAPGTQVLMRRDMGNHGMMPITSARATAR